MRHSIRNIASLIMTFVFALTSAVFPPFYAAASEANNTSFIGNVPALSADAVSYINYLNAHLSDERPLGYDVVVPAAKYSKIARNAKYNEALDYEVLKFEGYDDVFLWKNDLGSVTYDFTVLKTGMYALEFDYYPVAGKNGVVKFGLMIDGKYPYNAASAFSLNKMWRSEGGIRKDSHNNQLFPVQTEYETWVRQPVKDGDGIFDTPYEFYLTEGRHKVTLTGEKMNCAFYSLTFKNYPAPAPYKAPSKSDIDKTPALKGVPSAKGVSILGDGNDAFEPNPLGTMTIFIQAEEPKYKNSPALVPTAERNSAATNPSHPTDRRYNTIGADSWKKTTQSITWQFNIPADGYYKIGMRARQNENTGLSSFRTVYIDDTVPFDKFEDIEFPHFDGWYVKTLTAGGDEPAWVHLTAGTHTITMEASEGNTDALMYELNDIVGSLNMYCRRIIMATGIQPEADGAVDTLNDYYIENQLPGLIPAFTELKSRLEGVNASMEAKRGKSATAAVNELAFLLGRCIDNPDSIPSLLKSLKDATEKVAVWKLACRDQPLELDYIEIATAHEEFSPAEVRFLVQTNFSFKSFVGSFFSDYTKISDVQSSSVSVWVNLPRESALAVRELTTNYFNEQNPGFRVSVEMTSGSIIEAVLAGRKPDVCLYLSGDETIQLASRGVTVDLTRFRDYSAVNERFTSEIDVQFAYGAVNNDERGRYLQERHYTTGASPKISDVMGIYGMPITQSFPVMFYRKDILQELGLNPPETWADLTAMLPVLQRNYLSAGLVNPISGDKAIFESGDTFAMLQLQTGDQFYRESYTEVNLDSPRNSAAFETWTKFYSLYGLPMKYDAISHFRTGDMPIIIRDYSFMDDIAENAMELNGLWDYTNVPGSVLPDGTISHAVNSTSDAGVLFEGGRISEAWTYLKWFTSEETQTMFGRNVYARTGRTYNTANKAALKTLALGATDWYKLSSQMEQTRQILSVPASYATMRYIRNAFETVVYGHWHPYAALAACNQDINLELERKSIVLR